MSLISVAAGIAAMADTNLTYRTGSLPKDEPQAVYTDDPKDCWNRIFYCLFTRTLKIRLSEDFPEGAPFTFTNQFVIGGKGVSTRLFERIESGDRAAEPLYPHEMFRDDVSTAQLLTEPRFSEFKAALTEALAEKSPRSPVERVLMQNDVWAAYDFVVKDVSDWILPEAPIPVFHERQAQLRDLLAQFIRKLALTSEEIRALPDTYELARTAQQLPDLFSTNSPWLEVLWLPDRLHDRAAHGRRAARVFVKPSAAPPDKLVFLKGARKGSDFYRKLDAVALVVQDLLVDSKGRVVPSPLTCAIQMRVFGAGNGLQGTRFLEYELSRRALLTAPASSGLKDVSDVPAYLPGAGNDYSFAAPIPKVGPVAVSLRSRCAACHGPDGSVLFTFSERPSGRAPEVELLNPSENEHARRVAGEKMKGKYFKALTAGWQ